MSGIIKVEGNIEFYYEDSGTNGLDSSDYTTMVFIHGMGFNGSVFRRMFPFGPSHNYRLISLYRRGYAPSTPWTEAEAALYKSTDAEGGKKHLRLAGLQIVRFLLQFATSQTIPKYNEERKTGGIHLVGWSLGTIYLQGILANLDSLATEELHALEGYLRTVLYFDTFPAVFAMHPPKPLGLDQACLTFPDKDPWVCFNKYVRGFFAHRNRLSRDIADIEFGNFRTDKPLSLHDVTEEELEKMISFEMYKTHDMGTLIMPPEVFTSINRRALFDIEMAKYLPKLKISFLCGTEGAGEFIYIVHELERCLKQGPSAVFGEGAERARDFQVTYLERGNHFVFWDEPCWALEQMKECVDG